LINRRRIESVLDSQSFRAADFDADHYLVVIKIRGRSSVSKGTSHIFHMEGFKLKKLNQLKGNEQYCVDVSNRFAVWENVGSESTLIELRKLLQRI
jgi:hypothetical protein